MVYDCKMRCTGDTERKAFKQEITLYKPTTQDDQGRLLVIVVIQRSQATVLMNLVEENPIMLMIWKKMPRQICLRVQNFGEEELNYQNPTHENVPVDNDLDIGLCSH